MFQQKLFNYSDGSQIQVYFDGLCQPVNPGGTACYSFIIKQEQNIIYSEYGLAAHNSTNNVAEYTSVIKGLEWLIEHNFMNQDIIISGDSLLVISQINRV